MKPKDYCGGDSTRCTLGKTGECPLYGTPMTKTWRDGRVRVRGCGDVAARNSRNNKKGKKLERAVRKAAGIVGAGDEAGWGGPTRIEVKKGGQIEAPTARIEAAYAQSEMQRSIGDPRPIEVTLQRDGSTTIWSAHKFSVKGDESEHMAYIAAWATYYGWIN